MDKTLDQIAWNVSEPEYRADLALSYSTLAKFEREGFDNLGTLFAHVDTPSLLLGSMVDTLVTGSREEFDSLYYVADIPPIGEKEQQAAKGLYQKWGHMFFQFDAIPSEQVLEAANIVGFYLHWRDDTRVRVLRERCPIYYNTIHLAKGKRVVDTGTYNTALSMVKALRESPATSGYFADNQPGSPVQRYYQLKFKFSHDGVDYRSMADLLVCLYDEKRVIPCDLKTSSHSEWNFQDSFLQWGYMIQSRLYWRNIRANMDKDPYFKDFTLDDYHFIVVNRKTLTPLVWRFPYTKVSGVLIDGKGNRYRDPFDIGKELCGYLYDRPRVPNGIDPCGVNAITALHPLNDDNTSNENA